MNSFKVYKRSTVLSMSSILQSHTACSQFRMNVNKPGSTTRCCVIVAARTVIMMSFMLLTSMLASPSMFNLSQCFMAIKFMHSVLLIE